MQYDVYSWTQTGPTQEANNASQQGAKVAAVCAHNGPLLCGCRLVEEVHQLPNQDLVPNKHKNKLTFLSEFRAGIFIEHHTQNYITAFWIRRC